jgi:hypothetical protein
MSRKLVCLVALAVLLLAAGCSSDGGGSSGTSKDAKHASATSTSTTTTTIKRPSKDDAGLTAYCTTWRQIGALGTPDLAGTDQVVAQKIQDHYGKVAPLGQRLEAEAPASIKPVVAAANEVIRRALATKSKAPFSESATADNGRKLKAFSDAHCAAQA